MSKRKTDCSQAMLQAAGAQVDGDQLTQILARSAWTPQEAQLVLQAQAESGQSIAAFAAQRGLTATRLYNCKTRSKHAPVDKEPEPEAEVQVPQDGPSAEDAGLDLHQPGERQAYQYLLRAIRGADRMWNLLSLRRNGSVLLCVVRWLQRKTDPTPYSLVSLDLTEQALWWHCFATPEAAHQALAQRCAQPAAPAAPAAPAGPALRRVLIRPAATGLGSQEPDSPQAAVPAGDITIWMPGGARVQIPGNVPGKLLRAVLRTLGTPPC